MTEPQFFSSPDLAICPEAEGYLVYHLATGKLHRLNATASLILEVCEKGRTRDVLVAALADLPGAASSAVPEWLDFALREQLLVGSRPATAAARTASDYADTADELRQDGEILAAYVCQDHATMLEPSAPNWRARGNLAHILGPGRCAVLLRAVPDAAPRLCRNPALAERTARPATTTTRARRLHTAALFTLFRFLRTQHVRAVALPGAGATQGNA